MSKKPILILASKSPSRAMILTSAGVEFETEPAEIDETAVKQEGLDKNLTPKDIGILLAREKALKISKTKPDTLVIGADQILACEGKIYDKPKNMEEARETLGKLRGKTHTLISCVAFGFGGQIIKEFQDQARLTMKDFSDEFLQTYLNEAGPGILSSVGAYQLEGLGKILFSRIEGDFYTILGLPRDRVLELLTRFSEKDGE